jgi:Arc/MetJ-type ribon-helix-helix transcriptional regulator
MTNKYGKKTKKIHINIFIDQDIWNRVKEIAAYGNFSAFVRDAVDEKLKRMDQEEANARRFPIIAGEEGNEQGN